VRERRAVGCRRQGARDSRSGAVRRCRGGRLCCHGLSRDRSATSRVAALALVALAHSAKCDIALKRSSSKCTDRTCLFYELSLQVWSSQALCCLPGLRSQFWRCRWPRRVTVGEGGRKIDKFCLCTCAPPAAARRVGDAHRAVVAICARGTATMRVRSVAAATHRFSQTQHEHLTSTAEGRAHTLCWVSCPLGACANRVDVAVSNAVASDRTPRRAARAREDSRVGCPTARLTRGWNRHVVPVVLILLERQTKRTGTTCLFHRRGGGAVLLLRHSASMTLIDPSRADAAPARCLWECGGS
jgi:hypothetical protein